MFKTHIIKQKATNLNRLTQIRIIQKIIGPQSAFPLIILHQISMFLFKNPLVLTKPIFVKVQRPISIFDSENAEYLIKTQYFKKLNIIAKWKALQSYENDKAMSIRAAETFLSVFESFFETFDSFSNNKYIDGEFEDHFQKNNLYGKQLQPCISNLLHYFKWKIINLEITNSILKLIRNDIVFLEVEGQKIMWVIGSIRNKATIQQLILQLPKLEIMDQNQLHPNDLTIFQRKSQIIMRGEQKVLNSCEEQITLFDCYLDNQNTLWC